MAERDTDFELPLDSAGARLRRAREQAGLTLADIATRTKIAERHLALIEEGNYAAMASRAYAIGFARNYARALGLDEKEIAASVRDDFDDTVSATDRRPAPAFEPGDPARVPGSRLAWIAALSALAAILVTALVWRNFYTPGATLPDLTAPQAEAPAPAATPVQPATAPSGPVVFTATIPAVWVKFYDADGKQLLQKELSQGESYTVPADAKGPMLWTARPDALQVTIGGQEVARISTLQEKVKDVPVSAAALLARPPAGGAPTAASPSSAPAVQAPAPQAAARTPATRRVLLNAPAQGPAAAAPASPAAAGSPAPPPSTVSD